MKLKNCVSLLLAVVVFACGLHVYASSSTAYTELSEEEPVSVQELTLDELKEFFLSSSTDEILDPGQCNYKYGEVSVGGVAEFCHVYMRTFKIKNLQNVMIYDLTDLSKQILDAVKASAAKKYLKSIAKTYTVHISSVSKKTDGTVTDATVKVFISCGEKTEDRLALKSGYIADIASQLRPLSDGQRFIKLNELMLDGRFRYDMSYYHRCSTVALVKDGIGVCEEYAGFTSLVLDALGYKNEMITGSIGGVPHMWNLVYIDGRVYHLDILHNGPVNGEGVHTAVKRDYLLVSEKSVSKTHTVADAYITSSSAAQYDYVFDGYPETVESAVSRGDLTYLTNVAPQTTVSALCEKLGTGDFLRLFKNGKEMTANEALCSGCTAELTVNGKVLESHTVCVKGDNDGDGVMSASDLQNVADYLTGADISCDEDILILSSDMNSDGTVTLTDLVTVYDTLRGVHNGAESGVEGTTEADG